MCPCWDVFEVGQAGGQVAGKVGLKRLLLGEGWNRGNIGRWIVDIGQKVFHLCEKAFIEGCRLSCHVVFILILRKRFLGEYRVQFLKYWIDANVCKWVEGWLQSVDISFS